MGSNIIEERVEYAVVTQANRIVHMFTTEELLNKWVDKAKENGRYPNLREVEVRTIITLK